MSRKIKFFIPSLLILFIIFFIKNNKIDYDNARKVHSEFLKNSPFKETKNLPKNQRKKMELPPNAYAERMWELSMNPYTGKTFQITKRIERKE